MTPNLYTESFLEKDGQVNLKLCSGNFLEFNFIDEKNKVKLRKNGRPEKIKFDSVSGLATKLHRLGDSFNINCKDAKEVENLIKGKVKKLYYAGPGFTGGTITETIDL